MSVMFSHQVYLATHFAGVGIVVSSGRLKLAFATKDNSEDGVDGAPNAKPQI